MNDRGLPNILQCEREIRIKTIDSGRHRNLLNPLIGILRFMKCSIHERKTMGYKKEKNNDTTNQFKNVAGQEMCRKARNPSKLDSNSLITDHR